MEIFTSAPSKLDCPGTKHVGELGLLHVVSVGGTQKLAEAQLLRYTDRGYFASFNRGDAVAFVTRYEPIEMPSCEHNSKQGMEQGSIDPE